MGEKSRGVIFVSYSWSNFSPSNGRLLYIRRGCGRAYLRRGPGGATAVGHIKRGIKKDHGVQVFVRDNNVDQALKALKRKMQREGVFREMKLRKHYEKPSERKVRERSEAIRRARKLARKKLQREGLLAPTKTRPAAGVVGRGSPSRAPRF